MIVNRETIEVKFANRRSVQRKFVTIKDKQILFTVSASVFCELEKYSYIEFDNVEEGKWQFYATTDAKGFPLIHDKRRKNKSYRVCHSGLVAMILKSTGYPKGKRFSINKLVAVVAGNRVFELSIENVSTVKK